MGALSGAAIAHSAFADPSKDSLQKQLLTIGAGALGGRALFRKPIVSAALDKTRSIVERPAAAAFRGAVNVVKNKPQVVLGGAAGAYLGADAAIEGLESYHQPIEFGTTGLFLKRPAPEQRVSAAILGGILGLSGGTVVGAAVPHLAKSLASGAASGVKGTAKKVIDNPYTKPIAIGATSGAASELANSYASGNDDDILGRLGRGVLMGGTGGALAQRLAPRYSAAIGAGAYPVAMLGSSLLPSGESTSEPTTTVVPVPVPVESTLNEGSGFSMNPYLAGGLGALGTYGLISGAQRLMSDDSEEPKKTKPKKKKQKKAK